MIKDYYAKYTKQCFKINKKKNVKPELKDLKWYLPKEDTQMANKYMKRYSVSYVIKELQMKNNITMQPIRMAQIQNIDNIRWWECGATGNFNSCANVSAKWYSQFRRKFVSFSQN